MSQRLAANASVWLFSFSLGELRGKGVGRAAITYSIFTLDPPKANAHSHRIRSDFASEAYKVRLRMQQQNASTTKFSPCPHTRHPLSLRDCGARRQPKKRRLPTKPNKKCHQQKFFPPAVIELP